MQQHDHPSPGDALDRDDLAFARAFIAAARWQDARSTDHPPHQYSVDAWSDPAQFNAFAALIARVGYRKTYDGWAYAYLEPGDGWRYWMSPAVFGDGWLANRARLDLEAPAQPEQMRFGMEASA